MPLTTPPDIARAYRHERELASDARRRRDDPKAWHHLERAHIVAQPWPRPHTTSHLAMLTMALRQRNPRETLGQLVRVIVGGPASVL